ncbi:MAG: hypothetical protein U0269_04785 [Polyangiales bacterium]
MPSLRALSLLSLSLLACSTARPAGDSAADGSSDATLDDASSDGSLVAPDVAADGGAPAFTPPVELGRHSVEVLSTRMVVDSPGLPMNITPDGSNNNVDVVRHNGRVYMAWRTSGDHFASAATKIHVVSSTDELTWRFEQTLTLDRDLREPRFLPVGTSLFLYVARLGTNALSFDPQGISATELRSDGTWSALEEVFRPGFIAWRGRVERGRRLLIGYFGGEHIYRFDGLPLEVHLLETDDGRTLRPFDAMRPVVLTGGASETDFTMNPDTGDLFAVARNEAGDASGFGSKICRANAATPSQWTCRTDPRKFDSPLMFWHDGEAYLVGRRNLSPTGNYDLMRPGDLTRRAIDNQVDYTRWPKRCSLWRYVQSEDRIAYVMDLPSRGDTCFAAIIALEAPGEFAVYDYSSDIEGPDLGWRQGQMGRTYIYRHHLRFAQRMQSDQ